MCGPLGLTGELDHLFHNNGNGTFTDVTRGGGRRRAPGDLALPPILSTSMMMVG